MGTLTTRSREPAKALADVEPAAGMFLVVVGTADKAEIRFEGNRDFLTLAVEAVETLVNDILAVAEHD